MSLLTPIYNSLNSLLGRLTVARTDKLDSLDNLNATITSRSPASTALTNATWTDVMAGRLDAAISSRLAGTDGRLGNLDVNVGSRLSGADARLNNLDATVSTRASQTSLTDTYNAVMARGNLTSAQVWADASRSVIKSVQHGTIQIPAGTSLTATATINPAVNTAKAFIVSSYSGPWFTDEISRLRLSLSSGTTVLATRSAADGETYKASAIYSFHVVEFM